MRLEFSPEAWEHYLTNAEEGVTIAKPNGLLQEIKRDPFRGTGKPEPLKGNLSGYWSRRITREHRLVYRVYTEDEIQRCYVLSCRFHYD